MGISSTPDERCTIRSIGWPLALGGIVLTGTTQHSIATTLPHSIGPLELLEELSLIVRIRRR